MTHIKDEALDLALEALERLDGWLALRYGSGLTPQEQQVVTAIKQALAAPVQEPVGYLFQHEETGLTMVVDVQQVEWGFEKNNPRHQKIGPVYTTPPAAPVQEPAWYHAECDDPDYSRFTQEKDEAFAIVSDKGGYVTPLYTVPPAAPVQEPVAYEYGDDVFWHNSPDINDHIRANGKALVYATPSAAQRQCPPCNSDCDQGRNCPARKDK